MIKRCEDPHNRRRHHTSQRRPSPAAQNPPAERAVVPPPGGEESAEGRPGPVSAAVVRAARLSARADHAAIASKLGITEGSLQDWEQGAKPLSSVPFPLIQKLQAALTHLGAQPLLVADIEVAIWCDLVITAITTGEDTSCLMADPLANQAAFSELLAWSLAGIIPVRYRPYTQPGNLISGPL